MNGFYFGANTEAGSMLPSPYWFDFGVAAAVCAESTFKHYQNGSWPESKLLTSESILILYRVRRGAPVFDNVKMYKVKYLRESEPAFVNV